VHDVAREASVSLATVDRVLNGRPGVRAETAARVEAAIRVLDFRRDLSASLLARARDLRLVFLIPDGTNEFMANLGAAITRRAHIVKGERLTLELHRVRPLDPEAMVAALDALEPRTCDSAVIVATDDDAVRQAVDAASRRGVAVVTLVSDLPGSARRLFIGVDNAAAGRTAASLLGRFCPRGKVGVIAGSLGLRDHRERLEAFTTLLHDEFPALEVLGPAEGRDQRAETEQLATALLDAHPDLCGIYNLGAGNAGLLAALEKSGRADKVRVIAHELTGSTRAGLRSGAFDVVLDQNPDGEIRAAIAAARQVAMSPDAEVHSEPIEIGIFLRDNLR